MVKYYVNYRTGASRTSSGKMISKTFNTKKDALKFAYQKAKNFRSEVKIGRTNVPLYYDGQVICIKNKRFYVTFNRKIDDYGREYILHSDGSLGE